MPKVTGVRRSRTKEVLYEWSASYKGVRKDAYGYASQAAARADRDAWLTEQRASHGRVLSACPTLASFWERSYLPSLRRKVEEGKLRSSKQKEQIWRKHIGPKLGHRPLDEIRVLEVEAFNATLPLGSVHGIDSVLSGAFKLALRHQIVAFNPVRDAEKPRRTKTKVGQALPTLAEIRALADLAPPLERALILTGLYSGERISEILGLYWRVIDFDAGTVRIERQHGRDGWVEYPKTPAGRREIYLPPVGIEVLREHRRNSPVGPEVVFPFKYQTWWRHWDTLRRKAGIDPHFTFQDLRHVYATHVKARSGLPPSITKPLLGHIDDKTHDHYSSRIPPEFAPMVREGLEKTFG